MKLRKRASEVHNKAGNPNPGSPTLQSGCPLTTQDAERGLPPDSSSGKEPMHTKGRGSTNQQNPEPNHHRAKKNITSDPRRKSLGLRGMDGPH